MQETRILLGQLVDRLGSAVLFLVVAVPTWWTWHIFVWGRGIDYWLNMSRTISTLPGGGYADYHTGEWEEYALRWGIELVVIPLAAIAAVTLRRGVSVVDAPRESRSFWLPLLGTGAACAAVLFPWLGRGALVVALSPAIAAGALIQANRIGPVSRRKRSTSLARTTLPWLPWLGAAVAYAMIWYLTWAWSLPRVLIGPDEFGVTRWAGTALLAIVAYLGMIFFPRLTASLAGAISGPALFALVGYILFPSFMRDPEGRLADTLATASNIGVVVIVTAALFIIFWEPFRRRPLNYALWVGAATFFQAVSGTFNEI